MSDVRDKKKDSKSSTSQFTVIGKPRVDSLTVNRNIMIRFKNWEMDNKGKSRGKIGDEILEKEKDRMVGNTNITRRLRDTYPVMIGVCQGEFMKNVKLEEVGKLIKGVK